MKLTSLNIKAFGILILVAGFSPSISWATYCQSGANQPWSNCLEGPAVGSNLESVSNVVLNGLAMPSEFKFILANNGKLELINGNQQIEVGTLTGNPSVLPDIRFDQELSLEPGLHVSQSINKGKITSSCYHNALNVCMKNSDQAVVITTNLSIENVNLTNSENSSIPLGEVFGFFCCK